MPAFLFLKGPYLLLLLVAAVLHILLGAFAPDPNGYAYDFYSDAIILTYENGRLPAADACWVCYHPPLLPILGSMIFYIVESFGGSQYAQLFTVASFLNALSLVFAVYCFAIYLHYRKREDLDLVLWALLLFLPLSFITSFSIEGDMLTATLVVISTWYFIRYLDTENLAPLAWCALYIALASLAKYTGVVIALFFGLVLLGRYLRGLDRTRFAHGLLYAMIVSVICAHTYLNNQIRYGTPVVGNDSWFTNEQVTKRYPYQYNSFSLRRIVDVFTHPENSRLKYYPAYNSEVLTSHYGQLWTDFSMFTRYGRHGIYDRGLVYGNKHMPLWLLWAILIAGLVPVAASLPGLALLILQRQALLLIGISLITLAVYTYWFTGNSHWMLKAKYLLFLLPVWLVSIERFGRLLPAGILPVLILPSVVFSFIYCVYFALF